MLLKIDGGRKGGSPRKGWTGSIKEPIALSFQELGRTKDRGLLQVAIALIAHNKNSSGTNRSFEAWNKNDYIEAFIAWAYDDKTRPIRKDNDGWELINKGDCGFQFAEPVHDCYWVAIRLKHNT